jgi:hypothetical protein
MPDQTMPDQTTPDLKIADHTIPYWTGPIYLDVLAALHRHLAPRAYLEIGVAAGHTLSHATCAAIGIDPAFQITQEVVGSKPSCMLFQSTSDDFFAAHDPAALLGGPIDFAFLDGLHHFDALLRDFMNTERFCRPDSVIALHDCMPTDIWMARREEWDATMRARTPTPFTWTGDVWKTVQLLRLLRPDLRILGFDAQPTGLVLVTGLDPDSTVLAEHYEEAVAGYAKVDLAAHGLPRYVAELGVHPAADLLERDTALARLRG